MVKVLCHIFFVSCFIYQYLAYRLCNIFFTIFRVIYGLNEVDYMVSYAGYYNGRMSPKMIGNWKMVAGILLEFLV